MDPSKYPVPDDWLETSERIKKRKAMRQEAKARMEARAKDEAKVDVKQSETDAPKKEDETDGGKEEDEGAAPRDESAKGNGTNNGDEKNDENEGDDPKGKRPREKIDQEEEEEELEETPPMYRQARGLFLAPEVKLWEENQIPLKIHQSDLAYLLWDKSSTPYGPYYVSLCMPLGYVLSFQPLPCERMQVLPAAEYKLKWTDPDEAGLMKFLVEGMG